ncbi:Phosphate import ATP-binding protein PstB 3 [Roseimaritima multifibrata]|uniref:Phosphate import ATP-binding protein PstB 3 n=1 Tax=Roseimaritima multifibrata TaxID=1930274 RepID=A0A517MI14_9BACT|nr:phosphate ABC transporter ATP-binding protein [Roseimaritima multifibrata]QDS94522.1 Phosphate import ATP-binding protein PstB 3 [Roseimaritima multifibrata]
MNSEAPKTPSNNDTPIPQKEDGFTVGPLDQGPPCCIPQPLIEIEDLAIHYGNARVLSEVSLTIHRGCITALIGPSGCGKTSFLTSLNRMTDMVPGCHVEGKISIGSVDVRQTKDVLGLRRRVGMIFQKPNPFPFSIRKNIEMPLKEHGIRNRTERTKIIQEVLEDVGLWAEVKDRLDSSALALSGGQQQRLCIARALALRPEILLLDEPCSALDPLASNVVEELLLRFRGRYTVVIVTHNLQQARRVADYAAFFWATNGTGTLIEHGSGTHIFDTPQQPLTSAYVNGKAG